MNRRHIRPEDEERRKRQQETKNEPKGEDPGIEDLKGGRAATEEASKAKDD
jgi:hypothetical protein